jgi:pimeloyl-ACP methyl ester carboxylesterase
MGNQIRNSGGAEKPKAAGYCTPKEDTQPQRMSVAPRRVLPIVFLPGIMGSNLRLSAKRQAELKASNNIAWRPDRLSESIGLVNATPTIRQLQLDPDETEVDIYDPKTNPTGDPKETADQRHDLGRLRFVLSVGIDTPLLTDDPPSAANPKTKEIKAKERGWGEIFFSSYRAILEVCEETLNQRWSTGHLARVLGASPSRWGAFPDTALDVITEKEHKKAVAGCWFPVHAMGYNWLKSNSESAVVLADRIRALIGKYKQEGYQCEKVILVTHSMGGLVARALVHPSIGGLSSEVLGIVHGVMPAIGAPAAYKRMRCGFEEALRGLHPAPKILGNFGAEVTAVLANAQGGLELLPSKAYGNEWLVIAQNGKELLKLPKQGNPYTEIYRLRDKWFGLLREEWINPAGRLGHGLEKTCELLQGAEEFHDLISGSYHPLSYAHYGADPKQPSWERVVWNLDKKQKAEGWQDLRIVSDSGKGRLELSKSITPPGIGAELSKGGIKAGQSIAFGVLNVTLGTSSGPGDQTVPMRSADDQLRSGKFSGIFRQIGYEHQGSYDDSGALHATLYSLSKIISTMKW